MANDKKIIKPQISQKGNIKAGVVKDKPVRINFRDIIFCSTKTNKFTNFLKTESEYIEFKNILFHNFIPECEKRTLSQIRTEFHHHLIKNDSFDIVTKVLKEYEKLGFKRNGFSEDGLTEIFQIGFKQGFRCVGTLIEDDYYYIFSILFFDPYHLIYSDKNHNHKDCSKNKYCLLNGKSS